MEPGKEAMTNQSKRLELTWVGKEERPRLEPRILLEDPALSYAKRVSGEDLFDNRLIQGDNLLALKALEQEFAGKVKCIYIDPPYNTGSAFTHYDDGVEHSLWLSLMRDRLEILRTLLRDDGSIWISIDDNEAHYLKVLCDEVFGRGNFVANVLWQKRISPDNRLRLGAAHDHILVYGKTPMLHQAFNQLVVSDLRKKDFKNPDNDPRGPWASTDCTAQAGHGSASQFYKLTTPMGRVIELPKNLCWRFTKERMDDEIAAGKIWFGKDGLGAPRKKTYLTDITGQNAWTWWTNADVGHNQEAKKESNAIFGGDNSFDTPKPERLIERILTLATNPGDLVLDSFLGSGTTAAVAHKMGRRWIGIELGDHAVTHCVPRLQKVVAGEDPGGITKAVDWKGGGGFRFYRLAPSLLEKDRWGNWVVSKAYQPEMLAEAVCKLEGFRYAPEREVFWNHGRSTERDFIYVTTQNLSAEQLAFLSEEVGPERSLLVCCGAFRGKPDFENLTVKKIPQTVLERCEWGRDDYSLNISEQAPVVALEEVEEEAAAGSAGRRAGRRKKKAAPVQELPLFGGGDDEGNPS
jgi:adenine-specific DNA-methyltransferase